MDRGNESSPHNPIIVQSDRTVFLEVDHPRFQEARDRLMAFAELEKSPERIHIYRITPLSLWNAGAAGRLLVRPEFRGQIKLALIKLGYPVEDLAGYRSGKPFPIPLRAELPGGRPFTLRPYQREAVEAFHAGGRASGGSGVVVLPC